MHEEHGATPRDRGAVRKGEELPGRGESTRTAAPEPPGESRHGEGGGERTGLVREIRFTAPGCEPGQPFRVDAGTLVQLEAIPSRRPSPGSHFRADWKMFMYRVSSGDVDAIRAASERSYEQEECEHLDIPLPGGGERSEQPLLGTLKLLADPPLHTEPALCGEPRLLAIWDTSGIRPGTQVRIDVDLTEQALERS